MAGAVPPDATKQSHAPQRAQFKTLALGVLFGLSAEGLARKLGVPPCYGRELLRAHQHTFRQFWRWSQEMLDCAMLRGYLDTCYGWRIHVGPDANPRSLLNFPMQAHGAEMMRLACCMLTEREVMVCAPVHDALLIEAADTEIDAVVEQTERIMAEASGLVIPKFPLRTEAKVVRYPSRYSDERGESLWETVSKFLAECADSNEWFKETG
jgi:DNA polymerase I-like protein with 3'-5' exonuclease and polymerase domains